MWAFLFLIKSSLCLTEQALQTLIAYDWDGNVRELKNTLLYAITMANGQSCIDITDLPDEIRAPQYYTTSHSLILKPLSRTGKLDRTTIQTTLIKHHGDLALIANALGISRITLWRYRKQFNL